jgi:hypothetical protein
VFENRMLRRIFEPEKAEVTGGLSKLCGFHYSFSLPNIRMAKLRRMKWVKHVADVEEMRNAYNILVGWHGRKRPLGRLGCMWENNIEMDLREFELEHTDSIHSFQDRDQW